MAARTQPETPPAADWEAANSEYVRGVYVKLRFETQRGEVIVAQTTTFMRQRTAAALTEWEKRAVDLACVQIGRGIIHPLLNRRQVPLEPVGAWMASPAPGVTLTWRAATGDTDLAVLLTLHVNRR